MTYRAIGWSTKADKTTGIIELKGNHVHAKWIIGFSKILSRLRRRAL